MSLCDPSIFCPSPPTFLCLPLIEFQHVVMYSINVVHMQE